MGSFWSAVRFLTIIPWGPPKEDEVTLGKSATYFPLVGGLLGLVGAGYNRVLSLVFPLIVADLLTVITLVIVRGSLHLDGLMDTADGIFGQKDRTKVLEVMRDSRVGAYGAIALLATFLTRWMGLNQLNPFFKWRTLVVALALGEWAIVYSAWRYPYAREGHGIGKLFAEQTGWPQFAAATSTILLLSILLLGQSSLLLLGVLIPLLVALAAYIARRLGGFTGDTYGAIAEIGEVLGFVVVLALQGLGR